MNLGEIVVTKITEYGKHTGFLIAHDKGYTSFTQMVCFLRGLWSHEKGCSKYAES